MPNDSASADRVTQLRTPRHARVPAWVIERCDGNVNALAVYVALAARADADRACTPMLDSLAATLRCSERTVQRGVAALRSMGLVDTQRIVDSNGRRIGTHYVLAWSDADHLTDVSGGVVVDDNGDADVDAYTTPVSGGTRSYPLEQTDALRASDDTDTRDVAERDTTPTPNRARARDELWDALMDACGVETATITASARGAYNRACRDLRVIGATPDEVYRRSLMYRRKWPAVSLTPTALARRWAEIATDDVRLNESQSGVERVFDAIEGAGR